MKKILLIEDDPQLLKDKIAELEEHSAYTIDSVENFQQLQDYLSTNSDDVFIALLDYYLKGAMQGQATDLLLEYKIPTIVYTEEYSCDIRETLLDKCVLEYLIKKPNSDHTYTSRLIKRVYNNHLIKALIVDGSESFRNKLAENLQQFGLQSVQSNDAKTTLALLEAHSDIQVVLIDLDISGDIQGVELVEDIRAQFPSTSLGILGVTPHGYNSPLSIEFLKKGANDFITKPFVKEQLNMRIMQVLEMLDTIEEKNVEAMIDPLTQLKNRRALERESKEMIQSALIANSALTVAMIDIDHFKHVNDTYGHDVGDEVLKLISQILKSNFRKKDLVVRNGGEEFCVLLDDLTLSKSIDIFEKLRVKIASTPYENQGIKVNVTVSIGLYHGIDNDIKPMLGLADKKLYVAKNSGRNTLVS